MYNQVSIGNFVENFDFQNYKIMSVDDSGDMIYSKITKTMKLPHNASHGYYKIKVHDKEIIVTGNHEFLSINGWKRADELKIKDLVLCPQKIPIINRIESNKPLIYNLIGLPQEIRKKERYLPQEIRKKERYLPRSPEKQIIELLGKYPEGLTREEITLKSKVSTSKITSILSDKNNVYYIPLRKHKIIKKNKDRYILGDNTGNSLDKLYKIKRTQNNTNQEFILTQLKSKELFPIKRENAIICARILGHLFSDGCLTLKSKQLFFSGKEEDLKTIKKDLNKLGYYSLGNIRHSKWKKGECWSFGAYKLELLSLFYSLGAPVGKKTDNVVRIPEWIMDSDLTIQSAFLSALFGGDGYEPKFQGRTVKQILIGISKREDLQNNLIEYLKQIQQLLSRFNITSRYRICPGYKSTRKDNTNTIEGRIWITNSMENIYKFLTKIGYSYCQYKEKTTKDVIKYLDWKKSLGKFIYTFKPVPYFYEWRENLMLGDSSYHYVTSIEKIKDPDFVYCVSTESGRFIANNIVVHNCDALTKEAQQALRRTMENYTLTTRFVLSCNYSSKIIDPIQSRCAMFRFKRLQQDEIIDLINHIATAEQLNIDEDAKKALYTVSEGDCRKAENILQCCTAINKHITKDLIFSMASVATPTEIREMLELAINNKFVDARNKLLDTMLKYGLSGIDIIKQINREIWKLDIDDKMKVQLIDKCGETEFRMTEGSDEYLQLEALLANFTLCSLK